MEQDVELKIENWKIEKTAI